MAGWTNALALGLLPDILRPEDKRGLVDQLNDRYSHGGGFMLFPHMNDFAIEKGWLFVGNAELTYTDPHDETYSETMSEVGRCYFPHSKELGILFESEILAILRDNPKGGGVHMLLTRVD